MLEQTEICDRTSQQMQSLFDQHKLTGNVPCGWDCTYEFADGTQLIKTQSIAATELAGLEQLRNKCKREHH